MTTLPSTDIHDGDHEDQAAYEAHRAAHKRPQRKGCWQWVPTDVDQLKEAEELLLHGLTYRQRHVDGINTISSVPMDDPKKETVVLIHGFAGGVGQWAQNWKFLADRYNVHAIDLPGFARSVRHPVTFHETDDAMAFFEKHLDSWFEQSGIPETQRITLVGHSFGAYVAAQYVTRSLLAASSSEQQEEEQSRRRRALATGGAARVRHLVLADPWGVPAMSPEDRNRKLPLKFRLAMKLFYAFAPLGIIRAAGPWGPDLLPKVRPDFADRWSHLPDPKIFYDYTYHCNAATPPTGELAFKACCEGTAFAKQPLVEVIPDRFAQIFGRRSNQSTAASPMTWSLNGITVLYGEHTWMTKSAGFGMVRAISSLGGVPSAFRTVCSVIRGAGHQLNTDNPEEFNDKLHAAIQGSLRSSAVPDEQNDQ